MHLLSVDVVATFEVSRRRVSGAVFSFICSGAGAGRRNWRLAVWERMMRLLLIYIKVVMRTGKWLALRAE